MEVGLIIVLFASNAFALECLYKQRVKTTGALIVTNLCLTVALAYQFQQMEKIAYLLLGIVGLVGVYFGVRYYLKKKKDAPIIIQTQDKVIENKKDKK